MRYVLPFRTLDLTSIAEVGGKNASLGELLRELEPTGVSIPDGFAVTSSGFRLHFEHGDLGRFVYPLLDRLDVGNVEELVRVGALIREKIRSVPLPSALELEITKAYAELSSKYGEPATDVAVRSSATAEDLPTASFAGQQDTYLNVRGTAALLTAVRDCIASLFTDRAIVYRAERGFDHRLVALSVGVQKMVRSDRGAAGVIFTLDTESGFRDAVIVTSSFGLGETVVQGRVNPDEFWVHKPTLALGFAPIVRRQLGDKAIELVYAEDGTRVVERPIAQERRRIPSLLDSEVLSLAKWAVAIERHYSKKAGQPTPMDLEWAKDGITGELFILQARPETVHSQRALPKLEFFKLRAQGKVLVRGKSVGAKIGCGRVRVIRSSAELSQFHPGEVLVAPMTDPDWEPVLRRAAAVVTEQGGRTCHAAIVSRELGLPCVVGSGNATRVLHDGDLITVSCAEGDEGRVYAGRLDYDRREVDPATLPRPRVPVMLNVGSPAAAFSLAQLPSAGVGLLRTEFMVSSWIGVHPMALVHSERIEDPDELSQIRALAAQSASPADFFVDRLA